MVMKRAALKKYFEEKRPNEEWIVYTKLSIDGAKKCALSVLQAFMMNGTLDETLLNSSRCNLLTLLPFIKVSFLSIRFRMCALF